MRIDVIGTPAPQGSKHGFAVKRKGQYTGKVAQVESSAKVKPWRQDVKYAALEVIADDISQLPVYGGWVPLDCAVDVTVAFRLARPKSHYRTGRNAHLLRDSAPIYPASKPDIDKLLRSTLDALGEAGVWRDDSQVVDVTARKVYAAGGARPGAVIIIKVAP